MVTVIFVEKPSFDWQRPTSEHRDSPARSAKAPHASETVVNTLRLSQPPVSAPLMADQRREAAPADLPAPMPAEAPTDVMERCRRISQGAYDRAERRGFEPGHMWEDWQAAERELDGTRLAPERRNQEPA